MEDEQIVYDPFTRLRFNSSTMETAWRVLLEIDKQMTDDDADLFHVGGFANGREQGFCLTGLNYPARKVAFAGHKNSDCIAVYAGPYRYFTCQNLPRDEHWDDACRFFGYDEHAKAAAFALNYLRTEQQEELK